MINGLGVLGWGVGGIEAEAAMLGQPVSMLIPQVVGFRLTGRLPEGATATDLVLTVTQMLRENGVVGKFVEFFGPGLANLRLADRATIANMAPEYGATCGIFPVDEVTLDYLRFTGRSAAQRRAGRGLHEGAGPLPHRGDAGSASTPTSWSSTSATVEPTLAGPRRPQDRVALGDVKASFRKELPSLMSGRATAKRSRRDVGRWEGEAATRTAAGRGSAEIETAWNGEVCRLRHGSVVIAAITSCTNTSNPSVMLAAGLVAKKAVERACGRKPWVKTSLAPGSKVVTDYLREAGLDTILDALEFNLVGYGCTTCIGNSGPLPAPIAQVIQEHDLVAVAVLSGNRNFEGRISPDVRANYLASPPLVVAYALAGRIDIDLATEPLGLGADGEPVYLRDIWPTQEEIGEAVGDGGRVGDVPRRVRRRLRRRRDLEARSPCRRARPSPGRPTRPTSGSRPTSSA